MNVVEIIALIIIASMIYDGFRIGFVKTIFKIIRSLIGIAVAVFACSLLMNKVPMGLKYVVPGVFFALIGLVFAVLGMVERVLNLACRIPIASQLNKVAGIAGGMFYGVVVVWVAFCVAGYFAGTDIGGKIYAMLLESDWLVWINNFNPVWYIVAKWQQTYC